MSDYRVLDRRFGRLVVGHAKLERLWTGASLIISDQPISSETGTYTDFIVLTR